MGRHPRDEALRVGLDARTLFAARPRGTGRNLCDAFALIPGLRPTWQFTLYRRPGVDGAAADTPAGSPNVSVRTIDCPGDRWQWWLEARLPLAAWRDGIDVLHCPANAVPRWCPVPVVATIHDLIPLAPFANESMTVQRRFAQTVRHAVRHAAQIITPSQATKTELVDAFHADAERVTVVPWAADLRVMRDLADATGREKQVAAVRQRYQLKRPWLLNFSGETARKNAWRIIDALAALPEQARLRTCLVMVGCEPGSFRDELRTRAERLGIGSAVRLLGFVPHADLPGLLAGAEGLLMPSLAEGFGLPILDAFAADVPVLTSGCSSMPEVAGDAAAFCNPQSATSIAAGIVALQDPERAAALRARGRERLAAFTWEATAERMVAVYERAAAWRGRCVVTRSAEQPELVGVVSRGTGS